ncbi:MAG TPA: extracellular solute-binding protein [Candidatus Borkfalkia stercoripullorum]|nr:extracellular solute-binding protein [Candidatus Borkfalkia stercoripullorum]
MKRFFRFFSVAAAAAILSVFALSAAGCASSGGGTVLHVYNWEDYISRPDGDSDEYVDLIAKFEEENPGVTVEYSTFGTNENMYNELKINAAGYDLVCPSDYMIMKMIAEDMVEPFTDDFLANSNYAKYASPYIKDLFEANGWTRYAAAYMWGTMGYVYNPGLVDENDLASWAGIWNGKYDHMSTIKDSVRDSYFLGVAYVYRNELAALAEEYGAKDMTLSDEKYAEYNAKVTDIMNRTDEDTLEKVKDALLDLKQYLYGFEVDSGKQDMITGKISINFAWSGDAVFSMDDAEPYTDENGREVPGIYLNYIVPEECSNIWFDGWVMPKGANVELAQKFIDFLSRPENAVANMNFIGYTSAVAGDEVYEEMIDWYDESAEGTPGYDEDGNALVPYDLNYFFGGTGDYGDYVIYVSEESLNRQISAQYPTEEVIVRSAVMQHFDNETNAAVNEMWEEVKGLPIPVWAYVVIAVIAALILVAALSYVYKGKRSEPKPKKGYKILKKGA